MKRTARVVSLFLLSALPAAAQHREVQTVEVVQVPVYVTSQTGVVTGLTRDNFELRVNGKRQNIDYFDVIDFAALSSGGQPPSAVRDVRQRRLYLLLFDLVFSTPNSIHRAQDAAEKLLMNGSDADEFAIAMFTHDHGIEVIAPFTRDRVTLTRAVRSLRVSSMADSLRLAIAPEEVASMQEIGGRREESRDPCPPASACGDLTRDFVRHRIDDQMLDLGGLARELAPLEGQKHVVLLTTGFAPDVAHEVPGRPAPVDPRDMSGAKITDKMQLHVGAPGNAMSYSMRRLHAAYGASGVFLDAIDIAGLRPGGNYEDNESLVMLARNTGGDVIEKRNDLAEAMQVLTDRQRVAYVLGFHAHNAKKENSISVRLRNVEGRPELRYRRTFAGVAAAQPMDAIRLADILTNDIPQNGVDLQMAVRDRSVDVVIPMQPLLALIDRRADLHVYLYVFQGTRAVGAKEKLITVDPERTTATGKAVLHLSEAFDLPPGDYVAKVVVTIEGTPSAGFTRAPFTVTAP